MLYPDIFLSLTVKLYELWKESYHRRPRLTLVLTVILSLAMAAAAFVAIRQDEERRRTQEAERLANLELNNQLEELVRVRASLQNLLSFVEDQQKKITVEQETIERLSQERAQLEPIVQQDRAVIEQILSLQAQRQAQQAERDKWFERGFGFLVGIISSMVASYLYALATIKHQRKEERSQEPNPTSPPSPPPQSTN